MILCIIQARMGSSRFPGKVLKDLYGNTILSHVIFRVKSVSKIDKVMVATSKNSADDCIETYLESIGIECYRGSEDNVLERYFFAAKSQNANYIVRVTADNPLLDPIIVDEMISGYMNSNCRYGRTKKFPIGLGAEIFSFSALREAYENASRPYEFEHVTPYMYLRGETIYELESKVDLSSFRFTVDTLEDYEFVKNLYNELFKKDKLFYLADLMNLLAIKPELQKINKHIKQKEIGE
jgi:spore coat polysaccharide biosynthesis protein SpsF